MPHVLTARDGRNHTVSDELRPEERLLNDLIGEIFIEMYSNVVKRTFD